MQPDDLIAFPASADADRLDIRVNFGVFAGREATAAELDDLARELVLEVGEVSIVAEQRHEAGGDVEGEDQALREAMSSLEWETPIGPVKLDENRQAIANNYLFKVTGGESALIDTVEDVNQTLGVDRDEYIAQPTNDRENPSCP